MNIIQKNTTGNWDIFWTEELKEALKKQQDNTQVGERLLLETDTFKAWSTHLPSGASIRFHKHCKPYLYIAITAGKSRSYYNDGSILETEYDVNDIKYFNDLSEDNFFIHNLENIGDATLIFTIIEFVTSKN